MLIVGNWKMNTSLGDATELADQLVGSTPEIDDVSVGVCPPFVSLDAVRKRLEGSHIRLGAQNMHFEDEGAYTGEVSAAMLTSVGCDYVILGHSERRQFFAETDVLINKKVKKALAHKLIPIVCVGETLDERDSGREEAVVKSQINTSLGSVAISSGTILAVAYEPVWAIGTGRTATPEQAQQMHRAIRRWLGEISGEAVARQIQILYGGSMKPENSAELLAQPDIDGGLIGGASLKSADFAEIVKSAAVEV